MTADRTPPMPGNVLQTVVELDTYDGNSGRYNTMEPAAAQVITSMVAGTEDLDLAERSHRPVLDLDLPAQLIPSSTPGHWHLYLDVEVPHWRYMALLEALEHAGVIEPGYSSASRERGYTAVRLPWVRKDDAQQEPAPENDTDLPGSCEQCGHRWADHHERDGCGACALTFTRSCKGWPL